jgi:hypothetical protein
MILTGNAPAAIAKEVVVQCIESRNQEIMMIIAIVQNVRAHAIYA